MFKFSDADEAYVIDLKSFTVQACSGALGKALASIGWHDFDGRITYDAVTGITAVNAGSRVMLFDKNHTLIREVGDGDLDIISVFFAENSRSLLVLCRDNQIRRYDVKTGALLGRSDVDYEFAYADPAEVSWTETDKGFLILQIRDEYAFLISEDDWGIFAGIRDSTIYLSSEDLFVFIPSFLSNYECGGFKRHTTESLIEYGRELLGDWELSEAQKMRYGIEN